MYRLVDDKKKYKITEKSKKNTYILDEIFV